MIKEIIGDTVYSTNTLGNSAHDKGTGKFKSENKHSFSEDLRDIVLAIASDYDNEHSIYWSDAKDVQRDNPSLVRKHAHRFIKKNKGLLDSPGLNRFSQNPEFEKDKDELRRYFELQQIQELNTKFPFDSRNDSMTTLSKNRESFTEEYETDQTFDNNISVPYFKESLTKLTQTDKIFQELIGNKYQMTTEYEDIKRGIDIFIGNFNPNILFPILDENVHKVDLKTTKFYLGTDRRQIDGYEKHPSFAFPVGKMFNNKDINEFEEVFKKSFCTHYAFNILRSNLTQKEITSSADISESKLYYITSKEIHNFYQRNVKSLIDNVIPTFKTFPTHEELEEKLSDIALNKHYHYDYKRLEDKDKDVYSMEATIPDFPYEKMKALFQIEGRKHDNRKKLQLSVRVVIPAKCFENNPNCYYKKIK